MTVLAVPVTTAATTTADSTTADRPPPAAAGATVLTGAGAVALEVVPSFDGVDVVVLAGGDAVGVVAIGVMVGGPLA